VASVCRLNRRVGNWPRGEHLSAGSKGENWPCGEHIGMDRRARSVARGSHLKATVPRILQLDKRLWHRSGGANLTGLSSQSGYYSCPSSCLKVLRWKMSSAVIDYRVIALQAFKRL
jgi:hypothetical protein